MFEDVRRATERRHTSLASACQWLLVRCGGRDIRMTRGHLLDTTENFLVEEVDLECEDEEYGDDDDWGEE